MSTEVGGELLLGGPLLLPAEKKGGSQALEVLDACC